MSQNVKYIRYIAKQHIEIVAYFLTFICLQSQNIQWASESGEWNFEVLDLQTIHSAIPL